MTEQHDEALVERVALALSKAYNDALAPGLCHTSERDPVFIARARAVIYPPAPPKTRLQVARELLANTCHPSDILRDGYIRGAFDGGPNIKAVLAALALPAMED